MKLSACKEPKFDGAEIERFCVEELCLRDGSTSASESEYLDQRFSVKICSDRLIRFECESLGRI